MQVDWLTVSAQWVNFLILVLLLRRFLYGPIVRAMDRRQQRIEADRAEARLKAEQAEREAAHYRGKALELEEQRAALLSEARAAAARERERLVARARDEVESMAQSWRREIEREKTAFQAQLRRELGHLVVATSRKVLLDLTGIELQQALLAHFLDLLQRLSAQDKQLLCASGDGSVVVASSAELSEEWRTRLADTLAHVLGRTLVVTFEPLPESACGVMLITPAYTLEWRLERYLDNLERQVNDALSAAGQGDRDNHAG